MKYFSVFTALATFITLSATAQDYRAFNGLESRLYEINPDMAVDYRITAVSVENVGFDGDSIYRFAPNWQYIDSTNACWTPDGPSLLGDSLRITSGGLHVFYNYLGHPIELLPQVMPGSEWTVYNFPNGEGKIRGTLSAMDSESVLGTLENVKTITLQMFDESMQPVDSPVNGFYFKIGQTTGLIETPALRYFPGYTGIEYPQMINLLGIENDAGLQNLTYFDIMDFQPDDKIEIETYELSNDGGSLLYQSERYLDRANYPDSIVYQVEIRTWGYEGFGNPQTADLTFIDSVVVKRVIEHNTAIDAQPGTTDLTSGYGPGGETWMFNDAFGREKKQAMEPPSYAMEEDTTFCIYWDTEGCAPGTYKRYIEGLGGPYYTCQGAWDSAMRWRHLKYFSKGDVTWGTSNIPLSVRDNATLADKIRVFPVPTSDKVEINLPENLSVTALRLSDIQGRTVRESISPLPMAMSVADLEDGVYVLQITLGTGEVVGKKIVVKQ